MYSTSTLFESEFMIATTIRHSIFGINVGAGNRSTHKAKRFQNIQPPANCSFSISYSSF